MVIGDLDIGPIPDTVTTKEEIIVEIVQDMGVCMKISTTIPCSIL